MIHEEICTYEVAKLAKEMGFDWMPSMYFHSGVESDLRVRGVNGANPNKIPHSPHISCPTQALLQRWLREEKNIHIAVFPNLRNSYEYDWIVYIKGKECWLPTYSALNDFPTYELALEDAELYVLKNLV